MVLSYHAVVWRDLKRTKESNKILVVMQSQLTTNCSRLTSRDLMKTGEASRPEMTRMTGRDKEAHRDPTCQIFSSFISQMRNISFLFYLSQISE